MKRLEAEDAIMHQWLDGPDDEPSDQEHLEARQSGNQEWKEARGEAGAS